MMSARFPAPTVNDDMVETLKSLHERFTALGHSLAWFEDGNGQVRLLVTVETDWQELVYQVDAEVHTMRVPGNRRSADLELSPVDIRILGIDGLIARIERELSVALMPETSAAQPVASERRVA